MAFLSRDWLSFLFFNKIDSSVFGFPATFHWLSAFFASSSCIFSGASHKVKVSSSSFSSELSYSLLTNLQLVKHATPSLLSKQHHGADHEHQVQYPLGMHLTYLHSGISKLQLQSIQSAAAIHYVCMQNIILVNYVKVNQTVLSMVHNYRRGLSKSRCLTWQTEIISK